MTSNIDLYENPQFVVYSKNLIEHLSTQVILVEHFLKATERLQKSTLTSNDLARCDDMVEAINKETKESSFYHEVSQLNSRELAFLSLCFKKERLQRFKDKYLAINVKKYVSRNPISEASWRQISIRLGGLAYKHKSHFQAICVERGVQWKSLVPRKRHRDGRFFSI